ncbi:MAG: ABC transporter ATP-binding protein [Firmicutes bacterium]|nr:ABC transporter ATP-binding protein [Bacillota bacterium]
MLELSKVEVAYGENIAVRQVTMNVGEREIVALIGNNGAGKTSILRAISGLHPVKSGRIRFENKRIDHLPVHAVTSLGIIHVPEGRKIFSTLTVQENLMMGAHRLRDRSGIKAELERVYDMFPVLKDRRFQPGGTLSGGEQQMLAIGRGLMAQPGMLLLDEPSLGLSPVLTERIADKIVEIAAGGLPILLVEQNARIALEISHRAYVLETGSVAFEGISKDLLENEKVKKTYLGAE